MHEPVAPPPQHPFPPPLSLSLAIDQTPPCCRQPWHFDLGFIGYLGSPYGPFLSLLFLARAMVKVASGFGLSSFTSLGDATYAQLNKPASHSPMALKRAFVKGRGSAKDGGRPLAWVSATSTHAHI